MPRPRFLNLPPDKRMRVLEVAAREFVAHGYLGASLNHVIGEMGLSKGAFYYYFDGKADLFAAVFQSAWDTMLPPDSSELATLDRASYWPRLHAIAARARAAFMKQPWLLGVTRLIYAPPADPQVIRLITEKLSEGRALQAAWVGRGQELGVVREDLPEALLFALVDAVERVSDRWLIDHWETLTPPERDALSERLFGLLRSLLARPEAASPEAVVS